MKNYFSFLMSSETNYVRLGRLICTIGKNDLLITNNQENIDYFGFSTLKYTSVEKNIKLI